MEVLSALYFGPTSELYKRLVVTEQKVDELDATAIHVLALSDGEPVRTGRLILQDGGTARIGRMAVRQVRRGTGIGGSILEALMAEWSHETFSADERDRARSTLRAMVTRLGETAEEGLRDPRDVVGPFVVWSSAV